MPIKPLEPKQLQELAELCPEGDFLTDEATRTKLSRDYYWYSPRLTPLLDPIIADAVIAVRSIETLKKVVAYAAKEGIPLTPRGAGTGNYGQAAPVLGGLLLDMRPLTEPLKIDRETGRLRATAGVRCQTMEEFARPFGWELPMYPSTWVKSTIGGFLAGGSAGIGSIKNGVLRDGKTVTAMTILDSSQPPQLHRITGADCLNYLHAYGVNGFIVDVELQLVPKLPWEQVVLSSPDAMKLFAFAHSLARDHAEKLRLLNFQQWPIPSFFIPLKKHYTEGESIIQLEVTTEYLSLILDKAESEGISVKLHLPHKEPRRAPMLSDFVQNHSTLWAKKEDPSYTYLSAKIDFQNWESAVRRLMDWKDPVFALRADFNQTDGKPSVAAGPIFKAPDTETLQKGERALQEMGIYFYDVHSPFLDRRGMETMHSSKIRLKSVRDPSRIFGIGKLAHEAPDLGSEMSKSW
ncbi:FAD-binding oxidoreductase [Pelagicoccus albus]|uniref:FAD-binding oxidoreductase n=1 Tax=Pelagicoccus albus TaxID=415222 RepID=A0A7X1BBF5_9BACT|nr:FAD-binding oxidoreductase [Pelagicoccus albus]MBC2607948.1 FAD-binding oxidoreductase [Pelagicoccus albus]